MKQGDIFKRLEPPPNGLTRLRARIDAGDDRWFVPIARLAPLAFVAAAAVLVIIVVIRRNDPIANARRHVDVAEVGLGIAPMPSVTVALDDATRGTTALTEVRTSNPNVAFYWVSSTTWKQ